MNKKYSYPCIVLQKPVWSFKMVQFYVEASDLKRWCGVYRKDVNAQGYQRILKPAHLEQIKKYLNHEENVIPNSIVIAFNDKLTIGGKTGPGADLTDLSMENPQSPSGVEDTDTEYGVGRINIRVHPTCDTENELDEIKVSEHRSAFIIDGQHRMEGGNAAVPDTYFPVTAFLGVTKEDQAFHFIVINRKAQKVSKHDIDAVIPEAIYAKLQKRLMDASIVNSDADIVYALDNSHGSPFRGKIRWANNPDPKAPIQKGAIDTLIKYTRRLPEDLLDEFAGEVYEVISAVWSGINRHVGKLWTDQPYELNPSESYTNQFLKKVVAVVPAIQEAINKIAEVGTVNAEAGKGESPSKKLEDTVYNWFKNIPLELFYCEWIPTSITNEKRVKELAQHIITATRKRKVSYGKDGGNWFEKAESLETKAAKKEAERKAKAKAKAEAKKKARELKKAAAQKRKEKRAEKAK